MCALEAAVILQVDRGPNATGLAKTYRSWTEWRLLVQAADGTEVEVQVVEVKLEAFG